MVFRGSQRRPDSPHGTGCGPLHLPPDSKALPRAIAPKRRKGRRRSSRTHPQTGAGGVLVSADRWATSQRGWPSPLAGRTSQVCQLEDPTVFRYNRQCPNPWTRCDRPFQGGRGSAVPVHVGTVWSFHTGRSRGSPRLQRVLSIALRNTREESLSCHVANERKPHSSCAP